MPYHGSFQPHPPPVFTDKNQIPKIIPFIDLRSLGEGWFIRRFQQPFCSIAIVFNEGYSEGGIHPKISGKLFEISHNELHAVACTTPGITNTLCPA